MKWLSSTGSLLPTLKIRNGALLVAGSGRSLSHSGFGARDHVHHPRDGLGDILDIGEVALHPTVVEDLDRLAGQDRLREQNRRHLRSAPRSIDREEAQPGGRQAEQVAVGVRHQLVRALGRGIEADRVIDAVVRGERLPAVRAVDRAGRGINEMWRLLVRGNPRGSSGTRSRCCRHMPPGSQASSEPRPAPPGGRPGRTARSAKSARMPSRSWTASS